jgi:ribosomal protein S18 acetylase RimI-like enzyme
LTVEPANTHAIDAYEKLGFRVLATDPDYFGPGEARTIMETAMRKNNEH